jgi:hypothetical protein
MENQTVYRSGCVRVQSVHTQLVSAVCLTFFVDLKQLTCGRTLELFLLLRIAVQCMFMGLHCADYINRNKEGDPIFLQKI